jgi:hypothetical protein
MFLNESSPFVCRIHVFAQKTESENIHLPKKTSNFRVPVFSLLKKPPLFPC